MLQQTLRVSRVVLGALIILIGIVLSLPLVPGPGLLLVFLGLTVLSNEFEWARRLRDRLRDRVRDGWEKATGKPHGDG